MFNFRSPPVMLAAFGMLAFVASAQAHVTIETREAPAGSYYKAVFRVPHGCAGSPTLKLRVRVPEGVLEVKPQPKAGWTLETVKGAYAGPHTVHGARVDNGVKEVSWSGNLPDEYYDEFVFRAYLADDLPAGKPVYFATVQECASGTSRWIQVPAGDGVKLESPAPMLKILPSVTK